MNLSSKKLKALWMRLNSTLAENNDLKSALKSLGIPASTIEYSNCIFTNLSIILQHPLPDALKTSSEFAINRDCPVDDSDEVYRRLVDNSEDIGERIDREKCRDLVWGKISRIKKGRAADYRIASNAAGQSPFETFNTTVTQRNPDSWVFSYNFPWHIISWLQDIHYKRPISHPLQYGDSDANDGATILGKKFSKKYLWMLACPDVIPVLSLRSFLNLIPFFEEIKADFTTSFGIGESKWVQDFEGFQTNWEQMTQPICATLGINFQDFSSVRERLSTFLFCVSLMDNSTRDLKTLVETGNKAVVLYGPPGTGKTYTAKNFIFSELGIKHGEENNYLKEDEKDGEKSLRYETSIGEVSIVQFHPNYSYQDFVGGIFPGIDRVKKEVFYELREGVFKKVCDRAASSKERNENKKFYLLIDEINRADLSAVFGELMYGLEYRGFSMNIPIFGKFSIPDNVYLVGTMNNTDKSLVGFDIALRRRFAFLRILPDMDVIERAPFISKANEEKDDEGESVSQVFATRAKNLNDNLGRKLRLPGEKRIGHAYFLKVKDFCEAIVVEPDSDTSKETNADSQKVFVLTEYALEQLWDYHLQPLLEEFLGLEADEQEMVQILSSMKSEFCSELKV